MTEKKFFYYTKSYPACCICGMRENILSEYNLDDFYCRICACVKLRKENNLKDEKHKKDENVMFNKLEIKRPSIPINVYMKDVIIRLFLIADIIFGDSVRNIK